MEFNTNRYFRIISKKRMQRSFQSSLYIFALLIPFCNNSTAQTTTRIANGAIVTVASTANATTPGEMIIDAGGTFINSGTLQVADNWTNNGTVVPTGGSTVGGGSGGGGGCSSEEGDTSLLFLAAAAMLLTLGVRLRTKRV